MRALPGVSVGVGYKGSLLRQFTLASDVRAMLQRSDVDVDRCGRTMTGCGGTRDGDRGRSLRAFVARVGSGLGARVGHQSTQLIELGGHHSRLTGLRTPRLFRPAGGRGGTSSGHVTSLGGRVTALRGVFRRVHSGGVCLNTFR